jgi:hypothetical protein
MVSLSTWARYAAIKLDYSFSLGLKVSSLPLLSIFLSDSYLVLVDYSPRVLVIFIAVRTISCVGIGLN